MKTSNSLSMQALILLFIFTNSTTTIYSHEPKYLQTLDEYINIKMERDHVPGLSVCLIKDGDIVWSKGYGWANTEKRIPMTKSSVLGVASISKLITATAVMQLHDQNLINVNSPINKYLPFKIQHPNHPDYDIKISQILNHTASISNGPSLWRTYTCFEKEISLEEWTKSYFLPGGKFYDSDGNFGKHRPGDGFLYTNAGYGLLSYLVEYVSDQSFNEYCKKNIFDPIGMNNTSFVISNLDKNDLAIMYTYGYEWDLERDLIQKNTNYAGIIQSDYFFPLCHYTSPTFAAGGLYSSVEDLSKFLISLMNRDVYNNHRILSKESIERILSPSVDASFLPGQFSAFGLGGYAMKLSNDEPVWGHTGADPGISSYMLFNSEINMGAIVLANRFVDIRDLIEWFFAEGFSEFYDKPIEKISKNWKQYSGKRAKRKIDIMVESNYLPGGSQLYIIGNHRYFGQWMGAGIPLLPGKNGTWSKTFFIPDSTKLEFKITRGSWNSEAVNFDGTIPPNFSFVAEKDTVLNIKIDDWKDLLQN